MIRMTDMPIILPSAHEQIKLCYAFLTSPKFFHQKLTVFNPHPMGFDPKYFLPLDFALYQYDSETDSDLISVDKLIEMAVKNRTTISCVGSHKADERMTIQLLWTPAKDTSEPILIAQVDSRLTAKVKIGIIEHLRKMSEIQ